MLYVAGDSFCKRTVSAVALRDLTWRPIVPRRRRADPARGIVAGGQLRRIRPSSRESRDDASRRAVQREQTPSVATEGVCSSVLAGVGYGGEAAAAEIIRQGTSSSMRLMVWPSAILARISRR